MCKHTIMWRCVIQVPFKAQLSGFSLATLHITSYYFFDAALYSASNLQNDMVMVGHDFIGKDFYLGAKVKHSLLLVDENPTDSRFFYLGIGAIVDEFAENRFAPFGNHCHVHDAWLMPSAGLLPSGSLVRYVGVEGHTHFGLLRREWNSRGRDGTCRKSKTYLYT